MSDPLKYEILPEHLRGGFQRYVEHGIRPGHFLCAIIENDLVEAYSRGDETSLRAMPQIMYFVITELPRKSYGSPEHVAAWIKAGFTASGGR